MNIATLRELPVEERIDLVEQLWDSIATNQQALPLTDAQRQVLDERLDGYGIDGDPGRPTRSWRTSGSACVAAASCSSRGTTRH